MERPKREASKVNDFRRFHLSGEVPEGTVAATVKRLESPLKTNPGHAHAQYDITECGDQVETVNNTV